MPATRITLKSGLCYAGCGAPIQYRTNSRVVCEACKPGHRAEILRRAATVQRRKRGIEPVEKTITCQQCGKPTIRKGIKRKFCFSCATNLWRLSATKKLNLRIGNGIRQSLRAGSKRRQHWATLVGYGIEELRTHLERQFQSQMTWGNFGEWHIDHITPLSSFKFETPEDQEFKAAWALPNLRPLWAEENFKKSAKRTHLI